ncbi:MAG: hypothetical protein L0332_19220 [Chloroflexi bacterium]|nr:hypothetical protein [Chloroflexota bacterium]MCI0650043.1 hypothetical protein [Chloroflexota bacterium]MCI0728828.1 hypothetical protein [Chloroflexota bacterium]
MKKSLLRLSVFVLFIVLAGLSASHPATAAPLQQANLLTNSSLDEPYSGGLASGWQAWHEVLNANPKPENCSAYYTVLPKWSPELNEALIRDGNRSQHVGNQFDTWRGGVYQAVNVTAGTRYRFSFWAIGRAANEQFPGPSDQSVTWIVRAGIDPGNGVVVWGATGTPNDTGNQANWQQFSVEAVATGGQISVFSEANFGGANNCRGHLDVWFDQAELVALGPPPTNTPPPQPTQPPPPPRTNTPVPPTNTPTPEVTPTNTPIPTDTPTNTPEPPQGAVICVNAFSDENSNGQRDADEGYMAGVTFTIAQNDEVVVQGVSPGTDNAVCFENIPAGSYQVAQIVPRNLETTTAPSTTIDVTEGQTIALEFGSRAKPQGTAAATEVAGVATPTNAGPLATAAGPDSEEQDGGAPRISFLAIAGLCAILVAIGLLGAIVFLLVRQQRA